METTVNWISCANGLPEVKPYKKYLVTVEYNGVGNINNRKTMVMTFEEKGRNHIPTWCFNQRDSTWKVLYWAELPNPCQE